MSFDAYWAVAAFGFGAYAAIISAFAYGQALQLRKLRDLLERFTKRPHSQDVAGGEPYVMKRIVRPTQRPLSQPRYWMD